jgi:formamidopyrimidine-DNA glycosylase
MPELPEMENYKRVLNDKVKGKTITAVGVYREKSVNIKNDRFESEVSGKRIINVERRAKHLLFRLDSGKFLLLHLMLGGWMYYGDDQDKPKYRAQIVLSFGEKRLYFLGLRLGYLHLLTIPEVEEKFTNLGPEPFDARFDEVTFREKTQNKRGVLKSVLVDQNVLSGIGNRYSDEICFAAELLPSRKRNELEASDVSKLYRAVKAVLSEAVQLGGYMDRPFYEGDTLTGRFASHFKVYNAEGKACVRCGQPIIKDKLASRKTFYCANCQH